MLLLLSLLCFGYLLGHYIAKIWVNVWRCQEQVGKEQEEANVVPGGEEWSSFLAQLPSREEGGCFLPERLGWLRRMLMAAVTSAVRSFR